MKSSGFEIAVIGFITVIGTVVVLALVTALFLIAYALFNPEAAMNFVGSLVHAFMQGVAGNPK